MDKDIAMHYPVLPDIKIKEESQTDVDHQHVALHSGQDGPLLIRTPASSQNASMNLDPGEDVDTNLGQENQPSSKKNLHVKISKDVSQTRPGQRTRFVKYVKLKGYSRRNDSLLEIKNGQPLEGLTSNEKNLLGPELKDKLVFETLISRGSQTEWKWVTMAVRWRHARLIAPTWTPTSKRATVIIRLSEFPLAQPDGTEDAGDVPETVSDETENVADVMEEVDEEKLALSEVDEEKLALSEVDEDKLALSAASIHKAGPKQGSVSPAVTEKTEPDEAEEAEEPVKPLEPLSASFNLETRSSGGDSTTGQKATKKAVRKFKGLVTAGGGRTTPQFRPKFKVDKCVDTCDLCFDPDLVGVSLLAPITQDEEEVL